MAAMILRNQGIKLDYEGIERAVSDKENLPCRLTPLEERSLPPNVSFVYFDVGHNPDAILQTLKRVINMHPTTSVSVVYGCKERKDFLGCVHEMDSLPNIDNMYCVQAKNTPAAVDSQEIYSQSRNSSLLKLSVHRVANGDIKSTMAQAVEDARGDSRPRGIVVIGSFTVMRESREYFGICDPRDD